MSTHGHSLLLSLIALSFGCAQETNSLSDVGSTTGNSSQSESSPQPPRAVLPFSLDQVMQDSNYSLVEAHGIKGGGHFWAFSSSDGTAIDVEGFDRSHLTKISFFARPHGSNSDLSADLKLIQPHVRRILPKEPWTHEEALGWSSDVVRIPARRKNADLMLELSAHPLNGSTILTIETSENARTR